MESVKQQNSGTLLQTLILFSFSFSSFCLFCCSVNVNVSGPRGMCLDSLENCLYVCDGYNNVVRRVTLEGRNIEN